MGCDNGQVVLCEGTPFKNIGRVIDTIKGFVTTMAYDDNSNRLLVGASDKCVHVYDGVTGDKLNSVELHSKSIFDLKLMPEGSGAYMATCSTDNTIKVWKLDEAGTGFTLLHEIGQGPGTEEYDGMRGLVGMQVIADANSCTIVALNAQGDLIVTKDGAYVSTYVSSNDLIKQMQFVGDSLYHSCLNDLYKTSRGM